jgi:hypothetical protein
MRAKLQLTKLETTALSYVAFLRSQATIALATPDGLGDRLLAFVVIEAHNCWALFVRSFYLSCVFSAKRHNGTLVTCNVPFPRTVPLAIDTAVRTIKPTVSGSAPWRMRDEPPWQTPGTIITLSSRLAFSNFPEITNALSYPTSVFPHLRDFRHFIAHRNEDTMKKALSNARHYGLVTSASETAIKDDCVGAPTANSA